MKLSTKGRYAVTAMFDIALHHDKGPVSLADISERQGISLAYWNSWFTLLRGGGLKARADPVAGIRCGGLGRDCHRRRIERSMRSVLPVAGQCGTADLSVAGNDLWESLS